MGGGREGGGVGEAAAGLGTGGRGGRGVAVERAEGGAGWEEPQARM